MKKSFLAILAAVILTFTFIVSASAEEGSTVDKVLSFLEQLQTKISEKKDSGQDKAEELVEKIKNLIQNIPEDKKSELDKMVVELIGQITGGEGSGEGTGLESLIAGLLGGGDTTGSDESMKFDYSAWRDAIDEHAKEDLGKTLEAGDEQILFSYAFTKPDGLFSETEFLGFFGLTNYTADGKDLKMKNYISDIELMTIDKDEKGAYKVTDVIHSEDGEKYSASVTEMCGKYGIQEDAFYNSLAGKDWLDLLNMSMYLDNHPQYERIEYQGELKTKAEIEEISEQLMTAIYKAPEGDAK